MNLDQSYDLYLNVYARVRAGVEIKEHHLQNYQSKADSSRSEYVDFTGDAVAAVALAVHHGKGGAMLSKSHFSESLGKLTNSR